MGNDGNRALLPFEFGHRQADSFNADGAFENRVAFDFGWNFNAQPEITGIRNLFKCNELPDAVHMPLHHVTAKTSVGLHGQFQVHKRSFMDAREGCARPGFRSKIGGKGIRFDVESSEAHAAYGDAVPGAELLIEL